MIIVSFACNNPETGDPLNKVCAVEVHGDVGCDLEFESPSFPDAMMRFSVSDGGTKIERCDGRVKLGRHFFECCGYRTWYGNWCWDATSMPAVEVRRLILVLRELGWKCVAGEVRVSDAYDAGAEITPEMLSYALGGKAA